MEEETKKVIADKYVVPDDIKNKARDLVKQLMTDNNVNAQQLADKLNKTYGRSASRTNIVNKFTRSSFQLTELIQIAEMFDSEVKVIQKEK